MRFCRSIRKHCCFGRFERKHRFSLDEPMAGNEAGQRLLAVGVTDSTDANVRILLAQLQDKGWLDKQGMEDAEQYNWLQSLKLGLAYGIWSTGHFDLTMKTKMTCTVSGLGDMKEQVNILLENASPKACRLDGGATGIITINPGDAAGGIYTTSTNSAFSYRAQL